MPLPRDSKTISQPIPRLGIELRVSNEAAIVQVGGLVDEHFAGFGIIDATVETLVIDVSGMTRMSSFGVRQWLKAMEALPKTISDLYILGCPTFFVDQLNMVLNFGGAAKVLSIVAPYTCPSCSLESGETIDVLAERILLGNGGVPAKDCARCGAKLAFDETPESYFSFTTKYAASSIHPAAAQLLADANLYIAAGTAEKPPRIIKLVHGPVTYFRIIGTIGSMFRARPLLVGAEGEVVIDLAEVDRFDALGSREWRRLLKSLVGQVPSITLVDVNDAFLSVAADSFTMSRRISVWSVLVPYFCVDCGRTAMESQTLRNKWPIQFKDHVCSKCGGTTRSAQRAEALAPLQKAVTAAPPASAKLIASRKEIMSRAFADASVADAGNAATASLKADDTILGKYRIVRQLSSGGMAEVFLANQVGIGGFEKPVALKRILRQLLESRHLAVDMFLNEAKIAGRLMHQNIVQVLDIGQVGGALYIAMEYVHGKDLREVVKKLRTRHTKMALGDACFIVTQIAQALHHAYWSTDLAGKQLAVVHRDVSPHNVILGYDGSVKLLDFGVAMSAVTEQQSESMIAGKWGYMSPEHTTNKSPVDHRSDLFSVGVILYLLVTGSAPFSGNDPRTIVKKIRSRSYKPLKQMAPDIPESLAELIVRLLEPNPDDRVATGLEIATELTELARNYGIESSSERIAAMVTELFEGDTDEVEFARSSRSLLTEAADGGTSGRVRGSGAALGSSRSSSSFSASPHSPTSLSAATMPTGVSEPWTDPSEIQRNSEAMSGVDPLKSAKMPELRPRSARVFLILMFAILVAAAILGVYLVVQS